MVGGVCNFLFLQVGGKNKKFGNHWYRLINKF